jgi:flagellar assembly protein FliH/type III secretion protein L
LTLQRARIVRRENGSQADTKVAGPTMTPADARKAGASLARARLAAAEVLAAQAEAERILERAKRDAEALVASAADRAGAEAREHEIARLAAGFLALRRAEEERAARELDRVVELATLLAERLVGEAICLEPARVGELAAAALEEVRGARQVRIDACPDDVSALRDALGAIGQIADVKPDGALARGSLVVHTDLGHVDARLAPQLARLAEALREALQ